MLKVMSGTDQRTTDGAVVLVVEDSESAREVIVSALRDLGVEVAVADCGQDALDWLRRREATLLLLDYRLPDMTGKDVIEAMAAEGRATPFIIITGHGDEKIAVEMMKLGAREYLVKDGTFTGLVPTMVGKVLDHLAVERRLADAERALRDEQARYRAVVEDQAELICRYLPDGTLTFVNGAYCRYFGMKREELVGKTFLPLIPPEDYPAVREHIAGLTSANPLATMEHRVILGNGEIRWQQWVDRALFDASGEITEFQATGRDITERKLAELNLQNSEEKYRRLYDQFQTLLDGIPDFICLVDRNFRVIWANRSYLTFFGLEAKDLEERRCYESYRLAEPCEECPLTRCFATGSKQEGLKYFDDRIFGVKVFPMGNVEGPTETAIILTSDITERIMLREEAERAGRLASLGELAAGVAHEINNPNALVLLNAPVLREIWAAAVPMLDRVCREHGDFPLGQMSYSRLRGEVPRLFEEVEQAARRIRGIVEELKEFVNREDGAAEQEVDLNEVVRSAASLVRNTRKAPNLEMRCGEPLPPVRGNFQRLEQVVINLIINALQSLASPGGKIRIACYHDVKEQANVVEVRDEGVGIPAEILPRITDPFFTTNRATGGTGLGLSVSARIVKDHGGRLHFASTPGQGTTVKVVLPVVPEKQRR